MPQAVISFLKEYDLSGKTVIPFCTHDGYGAGRSYGTIAEASHAEVTLDGIAIEAKEVTSDLAAFETLGSRAEITFSLADKEGQQGDAKEPGNGNRQQNDMAASENDDTTDGVKVLVAYFSATNITKGVAEKLADGLGADLYQIVPETPYTSADLNYNSNSSRTTIEMNDPNARPPISGSVENMEQYDIIFLGYLVG